MSSAARRAVSSIRLARVSARLAVEIHSRMARLAERGNVVKFAIVFYMQFACCLLIGDKPDALITVMMRHKLLPPFSTR